MDFFFARERNNISETVAIVLHLKAANMSNQKAVQYSVSQLGTIIVMCPSCEKVRIVDVEKLKRKKHCVQVRCSCGKIFPIQIDFRQSSRKKVHLYAEYVNDSQYTRKMRTGIVADLSLGGLALNIYDDQVVRLHDTLRVVFRLDNQQNREIQKRMKVVHLDSKKRRVGCKFERAEKRNHDTMLRGYLC